jgi:PPM family protein phosphatase
MKLFGSGRGQAALRATARSDPGRTHTTNEDASLVDLDRGLFAVADGVGGQPAGDVAARVAIERLPAIIDSAVKHDDRSATDAAIGRAVVSLSEEVQAEAAATPELEGMATTIVMLLVDGDVAYVAHVGDSRAYLARHGQLYRLTDDHSLAAELVQSGVITAEEASTHPFGHSITQAIGLRRELRPSVHQVELMPGDRLLLCSDGLTDMIADDEIAAILMAGADPGATCESLVHAANAAGGKDNITTVIVDYHSADGAR